jgi:hypothetical protein
MKTGWLKVALIVLVLEKIVQHIFVTLAFYFNWGGTRSTVAVSPDVLMVLGALLVILFALALWGLLNGTHWAALLVIGLALFDIVGEFAAQGRLDIVLNVSFLVAIALLVLVLIYRRKMSAVIENNQEKD